MIIICFLLQRRSCYFSMLFHNGFLLILRISSNTQVLALCVCCSFVCLHLWKSFCAKEFFTNLPGLLWRGTMSKLRNLVLVCSALFEVWIVLPGMLNGRRLDCYQESMVEKYWQSLTCCTLSSLVFVRCLCFSAKQHPPLLQLFVLDQFFRPGSRLTVLYNGVGNHFG